MPEHRDRDHRRDSRSRSPYESRTRDAATSSSSSSRRHRRDRDRSRSRSPSRRKQGRRDDDDREGGRGAPPDGVAPLDDEDDYFRKATELKLWLWEEKHKKLDSLRTEDARRYFAKFCKQWNRGQLSENYYQGISPASLPSSISSSHSWSFKKASQADLDAAASVRKSIDTGSKTRSYDAGAALVGPSALGPSKGPTLGPAMPPPSGGSSSVGSGSAVERLQLEREARDAAYAAERSARHSERRRENREARQDERDDRATGRDRLVEKRREGNADRREFERAREAGGMVEIDDDTLMGGQGGGFKDALRERERQQQRWQERKGAKVDEKKAEIQDRYQAHRQKEDQTMAMFKQLAAARFGGGGGGGAGQ
ncbi:hypothetical protein BMF94_3914 [Rhodotorula taiwanensis]|uniref:Uncharacterized protein n=1 Tax=Rhodotorula taiwanensis TaxID=741276 RepID=A0A2S5B8H5_9BASI|nr:hypothetical protein BMF94_3914 [Rhodotorula taiwanensis]